MNKNKKIVIMLLLLLIVVGIVVIIIANSGKKEETAETSGVLQVKETFKTDIDGLKDGKYDNLKYMDFVTSIDDVEGVYRIEIEIDSSYEKRTFLENFKIMDDVVDKFFQEEFDKSYLVTDFHMEDGTVEDVYYNDIENVCDDERYNSPNIEFLFGNTISEGGYMVQTSESLNATWFSRGEMGVISANEFKKVYPYFSGKRQVEDVELNMKDGTIKLSELEEKALDYVNSQFPLPISDDISIGIGDVRIVDNKVHDKLVNYDAVCFKMRRIYKGVPFEYGSSYANGIYIDDFDHDSGELFYVKGEYPDTMLSFGMLDGKVVEKEEITEIISAGDALQIISDRIGDNSVYDVYGVELVYRNCEIPEERKASIQDILEPRWKITTVNQNDDKYTMFYVDVVTGEVTQRFEYLFDM